MKSILHSLFVSALILIAPLALHAQRKFGVGQLVIDDGSGNKITLQAPPSLSGSYTYLLPTPPAGSTSAGFVDLGTATGQTLCWNGTAWVPSTLMIKNNSNVGLGFASSPEIGHRSSCKLFIQAPDETPSSMWQFEKGNEQCISSVGRVDKNLST